MLFLSCISRSASVTRIIETRQGNGSVTEITTTIEAGTDPDTFTTTIQRGGDGLRSVETTDANGTTLEQFGGSNDARSNYVLDTESNRWVPTPIETSGSDWSNVTAAQATGADGLLKPRDSYAGDHTFASFTDLDGNTVYLRSGSPGPAYGADADLYQPPPGQSNALSHVEGHAAAYTNTTSATSCDIARCPACGGQLLSCGCPFEEYGVAELALLADESSRTPEDPCP